MINIYEITTGQLMAILTAIPTAILTLILFYNKFIKTLRRSFDFDGRFFMIGLSVAMLACWSLMNWTTYGGTADYVVDTAEDEPIVTVDMPRTSFPKKEKVKLTQQLKKKVKLDLIKEIKLIDEPIVETRKEAIIDPEDYAEEPIVTDYAEAKAPVVAVVPEEKDEEFITLSEQMPLFNGCTENFEDRKEKEKCAQQALLAYVYNNLKYPALARDSNIEGMVVIQFVVTKAGIVSDAKIVRDIGAGCGEAALQIVENMNKVSQPWQPGRQGGRKVNVRYTLPVKFKLQ